MGPKTGAQRAKTTHRVGPTEKSFGDSDAGKAAYAAKKAAKAKKKMKKRRKQTSKAAI